VAKALAVLTPPPDLTISDWADQNRRLSSEASAEPGQWRTSRAEYQRGIMDAISDPAAETVVIMSSSQIGKSESILNMVGYHIDHDPAPIMVVMPTERDAETWSKDRFSPMARDTPSQNNRNSMNSRRCETPQRSSDLSLSTSHSLHRAYD
jgi:phage terminase large subunit GpA-like protein